jgi:hypothetical protein
MLKKIGLFGFIFIISFTFSAFATDTPKSGIKTLSADEYLNVEQAKMVRSFTGKEGSIFENLPKKIDISSKLPQAGNQGNQNSCTAWAIAYAVKSFQELREHGWDNEQQRFFSPSFVYNQISKGKDNGLSLPETMHFIMDKGTIPLEFMPYDEKNSSTQPSKTLKTLGESFRALGYRRIDTTNINIIKAYLASGEPVIIVLEMFSNFIGSDMAKNKGLYKAQKGQSLGFHALVAVGYNDASQQVKLLNSWGSEWGDNGYGYVSYDFFPKIVKRAYILYDTPTPKNTLQALNSYYKKKNKTRKLAITHIPAAPAQLPETDVASDFKVGISVPSKTLLIVPEESGITLNGKWLRLANARTAFKKFFSGKTPSDIRATGSLTNKDIISKLVFFKTKDLNISTNLGISFDSTRKDVHRVYKKPDFYDKVSKSDTYFYHAITEKWGGLNIPKHVSMTFHYTRDDRVLFIILESVFKNIKTGKGNYQDFLPQEKQKDAMGKIRITSPDKVVSFSVPTEFTDIKKLVWQKLAYGYFLKRPGTSSFIGIKVIQMEKEVTDKMLTEFIQANLKLDSIKNLKQTTEAFGNLSWQTYYIDGFKHLYFAKNKNKTILIQIISTPESSRNEILDSFSVQ